MPSISMMIAVGSHLMLVVVQRSPMPNTQRVRIPSDARLEVTSWVCLHVDVALSALHIPHMTCSTAWCHDAFPSTNIDALTCHMSLLCLDVLNRVHRASPSGLFFFFFCCCCC